MLRCENGEFVVGLLAVIPILVPAPVIVFQQSGPVGHGPERLLLQREQGQFLHHPGHRLRAMLSARLSYFDTTICVYSSALMR